MATVGHASSSARQPQDSRMIGTKEDEFGSNNPDSMKRTSKDIIGIDTCDLIPDLMLGAWEILQKRPTMNKDALFYLIY